MIGHGVLWILTIFLGVVLTIIANDPIHFLLARFIGGVIPKKKRGVKGLWRATYSWKGDDGDRREDQIIELRQFGSYVIGRNLTGKAHWYKLRGKVELQTYFTGTWDNVSDGDIYHGAFQVVVSPHGDAMRGKWVGFNKRQEINHGPWQWSLLARDVDKNSKNRVLENIKKEEANQ